MAAPRAVLVAGWIFCVNAAFAIFNTLDPFDFNMPMMVDSAMINTTAQAANTTALSGFGIAEAVAGFNMFVQLILGPLTLVPTLLNMIGVIGIVNWVLTGLVWFMYAMFIFQILTGRMFKVMQ